MNINKMIRDISQIAVAEGLVDASWPARLQVKLRNREGRSFGGDKKGAPWISIATPSTWHYSPDDLKLVEDCLKSWGNAKPGAAKTRTLARLNKAWHGSAVWCEYASIAKDPEIGDLVGDPDDKLAPMAALLCHEIAHAIDYNAGRLTIDGRKYGPLGSGHGWKWRAIYRVLRNAYVATGNYKPAPITNVAVLPVALTKAPDNRVFTLGLPLFDIAA